MYFFKPVTLTRPKGNSEFCFRETLIVFWGKADRNIEVEGKQHSLFLAGWVIKCFVIPPNSKLEKTAKKSFALRRLVHKFTMVLRSTTWSRASRKFMLLFPLGVSEFWPTARDTFSSNDKNVFESGCIKRLADPTFVLYHCNWPLNPISVFYYFFH